MQLKQKNDQQKFRNKFSALKGAKILKSSLQENFILQRIYEYFVQRMLSISYLCMNRVNSWYQFCYFVIQRNKNRTNFPLLHIADFNSFSCITNVEALDVHIPSFPFQGGSSSVQIKFLTRCFTISYFFFKTMIYFIKHIFKR